MAQNGLEMVRYADDFVVLCANREQAQKALEQISQWVEENGLKLHPTKTRLVDASQRGGFDFLGYHFERGTKWPRKKSLDKLKDTIRIKTRRNNGRSMKAICRDLNRSLKGWFEYFKHGAPHVYESVDGYVRGRLRSILRHQTKRKGRARAIDQRRCCLAAAGLGYGFFSNTSRDDRLPLALAQSHRNQGSARFDRPCRDGYVFPTISQHFVLGFIEDDMSRQLTAPAAKLSAHVIYFRWAPTGREKATKVAQFAALR